MKALSVKQFNQYLKTSFKHDPLFQNISIKGEIANLKISHSHIFFSLKEDREIIDCAIYYYGDKALEEFNNGDKVTVSGNIIYNSYFSKISLAVNDVKKMGLSGGYLKFLKLKEDFYKKGYFDDDKKKKIAPYPKNVGLITSHKSAAIVDFLSVINKEVQDMEILLAPVKVQGQSAKNEIIKALDILDRKELDLIVITRGGGSRLDLDVFNQKELIEKIYQVNTPVISAIGHKIDLSLTDLVSDLSLQTPTEAGAYLVRNYKIIRKDIKDIYEKIKSEIKRNIEYKSLRLISLKSKLNSLSPKNLINEKQRDLDLVNYKIKESFKKNLNKNEQDLNILGQRLKSLKEILDIKKNSIKIKDENGKDVFSKHSLKDKDNISIIFSDGEVRAKVYNE